MPNDKIICPLCQQEMTGAYDEWGYTPFHFHCLKCDINIGTTTINKNKIENEIFPYIKKPHIYIEYYNNKVQTIWEVFN